MTPIPISVVVDIPDWDAPVDSGALYDDGGLFDALDPLVLGLEFVAVDVDGAAAEAVGKFAYF